MIKAEKVTRLMNSCAMGKVYNAWNMMLKNCELVAKLMKMNSEQKRR
jgi:hypothetical protein